MLSHLGGIKYFRERGPIHAVSDDTKAIFRFQETRTVQTTRHSSSAASNPWACVRRSSARFHHANIKEANTRSPRASPIHQVSHASNSPQQIEACGRLETIARRDAECEQGEQGQSTRGPQQRDTAADGGERQADPGRNKIGDREDRAKGQLPVTGGHRSRGARESVLQKAFLSTKLRGPEKLQARLSLNAEF